jgi:hypothetical protein
MQQQGIPILLNMYRDCRMETPLLVFEALSTVIAPKTLKKSGGSHSSETTFSLAV